MYTTTHQEKQFFGIFECTSMSWNLHLAEERSLFSSDDLTGPFLRISAKFVRFFSLVS